MSPASYQAAPPRDVVAPTEGRKDGTSSVVRRSIRLPSVVPSFRLTRAGNGTRTRDPNLGKVVLYQLSYSRSRPGSEPMYSARPAQLHSLAPAAAPPARMEARGIEPLTS